MNILDRERQIAVIAALCDGVGIRAASRITGVNRGTVAALALKVGRGSAELHDRMMVGVRTSRLELDELWAFVQRKRRWHQKPGADGPVTGDQYTYVALASSSRAIVSYLTGKRSTENTDLFIQDIRQRVIGLPEISTDGYHPYKNAIRDAFGNRVAHGTITKTYSVTHLAVKEASRRYSPAAVSRVHEALRTAPAVALGIADRVWSIGDLFGCGVGDRAFSADRNGAGSAAAVPGHPRRKRAGILHEFNNRQSDKADYNADHSADGTDTKHGKSPARCLRVNAGRSIRFQWRDLTLRGAGFASKPASTCNQGYWPRLTSVNSVARFEFSRGPFSLEPNPDCSI